MARQKLNKAVGLTKDLKEIGVTDMVQKGSRVELTIDPRKLSNDKKIKLGSGLARASAATLENDPFFASYFEGPNSIGNVFNPQEKMRLAMRYFAQDPLVGKIVEIMKVFSNDGFKFEHSNPKIKKFYDNWARSVDLEMILGWIFLEYYRSGNVTVWRELVPFKKSSFKFSAPPYSVDGSIMEKADAAKKYMYTKQMIPGAYTVLNPLTVYVDRTTGYDDDLLFNTKEILIDPTSSTDPDTIVLRKTPKDLLSTRRGGNGIPLNKKNVKRILRMRQPYEPYGSIMMERAFAAIHEKNKLRQMDLSMVNSVINQIIKVTVGSDEYPATPRQLKNLADAFRNVGKSQVIFWNHTLNIEVIRPDTTVLNAEKYIRVNEDIRNAFGISEVLTGGGGSKTNFATAFLSLKAFLTNLQEGRKDVLRWLRAEMEDIAEAMQFDSIPEPSFNPLSLTDEIAEKQIIVQLIDRGIISYQSAMSRLGYDPRIEIERRKEEKPLVEEGVIGIMGMPFQQEVVDKETINTKKEVQNNNKKESKKTVDNYDKKTNQQNRNASQNGKNPSVKIPDKNNPMKAIKGAEGRPKTPVGKKMPGRTKTPKVKGQASEEQVNELSEEQQTEIIMSIAEELRKDK